MCFRLKENIFCMIGIINKLTVQSSNIKKHCIYKVGPVQNVAL